MAREGANLIQQIGVQTVAGTPVPATKRFASLGIDLGFDVTTKQFRSMAAKNTTTSIVHKKMATGTFEGPLSYVEICYILAGMFPFGVVTAAGVSTWTFTPNPIGADSFKYFTLECGDDEAVEQYEDVLFTSAEIGWGLEDVMISGNVFAKPKNTIGSLTAALPLLAERPVSSRDISIFCDPTYAGIGTTALTDVFDAKISLGEKFAPKWVLHRPTQSYQEPFEKISEKTFTITVEANAQGRTLLDDVTTNNSTKFFRVDAQDGEIVAGTNYTIQFDFAAKLTGVREMKDYNDALYAYEMTFTFLQESTLNGPFIAVVKNALTAL